MALEGLSLAPGTFTNPYRLVFQAMRDTGIKRIFVMGTPSVRDPDENFPLSIALLIAAVRFLGTVFALITKLFGKPGGSPFAEVRAVGRLLDQEAGDLDWTMYRIGNLSNDKGVTKAVRHVGEGDWVLPTYRPGIAAWLVDQIERNEPDWVQQKPALYSLKR